MLYISFLKNEIYQLGHIPNKSVLLTQSLCLTFAIPHMFQIEWTHSKTIPLSLHLKVRHRKHI